MHPSSSQEVDIGGTVPEPPSFSDVVEAQRWASNATEQAEAEANRRGVRGSHAWEEAWRDALWTMAVQKRCVEVEARKLRAAAFGSKHCPDNMPRATPPPAASVGAGQPVQPIVLMPAQMFVPAGISAITPNDPATSSAQLASPADSGSLRALLERRAEELEFQYLGPVRCRLNVIEERLGRVAAESQATRTCTAAGADTGRVPSPRLQASEAIRQSPRSPRRQTAENQGGFVGSQFASAGPLPSGRAVASRNGGTAVTAAEATTTSNSTAAFGIDTGLIAQLEQHLAESESREEEESELRHAANRRREAAERKLRQSEASGEESLQWLRHADVRLEEEEQAMAAADEAWRKRHTAVQRQLRRTEVALGEAQQQRRFQDDAVVTTRSNRTASPDTSDDFSETPQVATGSGDTLSHWRQARTRKGRFRATSWCSGNPTGRL